MSLRLLVPIVIPFLLLLLGSGFDQLWSLGSDAHRLERQRRHARFRLDDLQAKSVAGRIDEGVYRELLSEFGDLVGLARPGGRSEGASIQLATFLGAVQQELDGPAPAAVRELTLLSITPGTQQRFSPFLSVEFDLKLSGRFFALPAFLGRLSQIGKEQACRVSVGALQVRSGPRTTTTGELQIILPVRAYFRE